MDVWSLEEKVPHSPPLETNGDGCPSPNDLEVYEKMKIQDKIAKEFRNKTVQCPIFITIGAI